MCMHIYTTPHHGSSSSGTYARIAAHRAQDLVKRCKLIPNHELEDLTGPKCQWVPIHLADKTLNPYLHDSRLLEINSRALPPLHGKGQQSRLLLSYYSSGTRTSAPPPSGCQSSFAQRSCRPPRHLPSCRHLRWARPATGKLCAPYQLRP